MTIFRVYLSSCKQKKKIVVCWRIKTAEKRQMMMLVVNSSSLTADGTSQRCSQQPGGGRIECIKFTFRKQSGSTAARQLEGDLGCPSEMRPTAAVVHFIYIIIFLYFFSLTFNKLKNNNHESLAALARAQRNHLLHPMRRPRKERRPKRFGGGFFITKIRYKWVFKGRTLIKGREGGRDGQ